MFPPTSPLPSYTLFCPSNTNANMAMVSARAYVRALMSDGRAGQNENAVKSFTDFFNESRPTWQSAEAGPLAKKRKIAQKKAVDQSKGTSEEYDNIVLAKIKLDLVRRNLILPSR